MLPLLMFIVRLRQRRHRDLAGLLRVRPPPLSAGDVAAYSAATLGVGARLGKNVGGGFLPLKARLSDRTSAARLAQHRHHRRGAARLSHNSARQDPRGAGRAREGGARR